MKKLVSIAALAGLFLIPVIPSHSSETGLKADVYIFDPGAEMPSRNPADFQRCVVPGVITESANLNFESVGAGVLAGCQENFVIIRLTGFISLPEGNYTFSFDGDDGMYLKIAGQELTNDEVDWVLKGDGGSENVPFTSLTGEPMPLEYWFFEWGGGAFAEVTIRDIQGQEIDQSNIFFPSIAPTSAGDDTPVGMQLVETKRTCNGSSWSLYGERLTTISEIRVAGQPVVLTSVSDQRITFEAPKALTVGSHKVSYFAGDSKATEFVGSMLYKKESNCSSTLLRYPGLSTGQSSFGSTNKAELSAFLKSGTAPKRVVCTGSAYAFESDQAQMLALGRARAACQSVRELYPAVSTQVHGFVSKLVTPSYQAVAIRVIR